MLCTVPISTYGRMPSWALVTPVRDEAELVDELASVVRAQELRPLVWIIVDDGSRDRTSVVLERLRARDPWIDIVTLPQRERSDDVTNRYARALVQGFRAVLDIAEAEQLELDYVANLDADVRPRPSLFAELIERSERDRSIGIASCRLGVADSSGGWLPQLEHPCGAPRSGLRLWRRECLEQAAFYSAPHWGSVTGLRARNRGWRTKVHGDLVAEVVRSDSTRTGWWSGFRDHGAGAWFVGAHPLTVAMEAVVVTAHERDLRGLALLAGYVESAMRGRRRSSDPELLEFYGTDLPRKQWFAALSKLKGPLSSLRGRSQ
jgi:glycosyltransferase involved in cell wall biosynthesis